MIIVLLLALFINLCLASGRKKNIIIRIAKECLASENVKLCVSLCRAVCFFVSWFDLVQLKQQKIVQSRGCPQRFHFFFPRRTQQAGLNKVCANRKLQLCSFSLLKLS